MAAPARAALVRIRRRQAVTALVVERLASSMVIALTERSKVAETITRRHAMKATARGMEG